MSHYLRLTPHDPVIARDGRPFNAGQRMKSLTWVYPSVLAGSLRSLLGKLDGRPFAAMRGDLKQIGAAGPFPVLNKELYLPSPADLLVREQNPKREAFALRPEPADCCTDLPPGLQPVMLPASVDDFKPAKVAAFWSRSRMSEWLLGHVPPVAPPEKTDEARGYLSAPEVDTRMHVKVQQERGAADEGMLFRTAGLAMHRAVGLSVRVTGDGSLAAPVPLLAAMHPLGGERRLTAWHAAQDADLWECPPKLAGELAHARFIRLVLATPAVFAGGWKPGWLDDCLQGEPPTAPGLRLKLIGVCIDRWQPISGWDMETRAPKVVRRLVPAGGVYFFERLDVGEASPSDLWLASLCDDSQDQRDGFGLALPGVWQGLTTKEAE
jgi:CRISPR-associated protein Cmr3